MQPITLEQTRSGEIIPRFLENKIVSQLLSEATVRGFGLNRLVCLDFTEADWEQFYQLIGYSIAGYHQLPKVSDASAKEASRVAKTLIPSFKGCRDVIPSA